jgi:hypothetical protein
MIDIKEELARIDNMDEQELKCYINNAELECKSNIDLNTSITISICLNRANNRLEDIKNDSIRKMLMV